MPRSRLFRWRLSPLVLGCASVGMTMRSYVHQTCLALFFLLLHVPGGECQGRLQVPLGRSSVWRAGLTTPLNYDDHMLECGGYWYKKKRNNTCGLCGDPVDKSRDHEDGGKFASNVITGSYSPGQRTRFQVVLFTNQGGYMEFKLCPRQWVSQGCFDQHPVPLSDGSGYRFYLPEKGEGAFNVDVTIPSMTCEQCVIQWTYTGSKAWGYDGAETEPCEGCGPQYQLRNCADVSVSSDPSSASVPPAIQRYNRAHLQPLTRSPFTRPPPGRQTADAWMNLRAAPHVQPQPPRSSRPRPPPPSSSNSHRRPPSQPHNQLGSPVVSPRSVGRLYTLPSQSDDQPHPLSLDTKTRTQDNNDVSYTLSRDPGHNNGPWADPLTPIMNLLPDRRPPSQSDGWRESRPSKLANPRTLDTNGSPQPVQNTSPPRYVNIPEARAKLLTQSSPQPSSVVFETRLHQKHDSPSSSISYKSAAYNAKTNRRLLRRNPQRNTLTFDPSAQPSLRQENRPVNLRAQPSLRQGNRPVNLWVQPSHRQGNRPVNLRAQPSHRENRPRDSGAHRPRAIRPADPVSGEGGPQEPQVRCVATGSKAGMEGMDEWCTQNCNGDYCPTRYCSCW